MRLGELTAVLGCAWLCACSSREPSSSVDAAGSAAAAADAAGPAVLASAADRIAPFPDGTRTVKVKRSVAVHLEPRGESKRIGTIARDIRVRWRRRERGPGCDAPWVAIAPRGWVCGSYLEPSSEPEYGVELPRLRRGAVVPGVYGKVVADGTPTFASLDAAAAGQAARTLAGAVKVRRERLVEHKGVTYWRVSGGEYLRASAVREIEPATWGGARLGDDTGLVLPIGFALARRGASKKVAVYAAAEGERIARWLPPRAAVPALETSHSRVRIGDDEWVDAVDLRVAEKLAPPPLTEPNERWIDVDLDRQVLVGYEGEHPVYATLISSGARKYPSETGIFRIWVKFFETDMNGQMGDEAPYSVATVPWTQFYAKDLALHTAYWHDHFGEPRSHGCINLAPVDARFLYFWSEPTVPPGWTMAHGVVERPGSMVRLRSEADPQPELKGYAKRVAEARRSRRAP